MRFTFVAALCLVLFAPVVATAQATTDDQQWLSQMQSLMKDQSVKAARQRATLAYWALTSYRGRCERLRIDPNAVRTQGQHDILQAAQGTPDDPAVWKEAEAWYGLGSFDLAGGAKVACPAFKEQPRRTGAGMLCGDCRRDQGDAQGAVSAWRRAIELAADRTEAVALVERIDRASASPEHDLVGVSPSIVQQARTQEQQQAQQQQQSSASIAACQNACASRATQCHYNSVVDVSGACSSQQQQCNAACAQTNGASAPPTNYYPGYVAPGYVAPGYYPGYYPGYVAPGVYVAPVSPVYVP
ncbi:MAG: tetratricopeptide repeat protein [Deltaproteobacteria bacterium]